MGYIGVKKPTDPFTFDPNFQRDIQVHRGFLDHEESEGLISWNTPNPPATPKKIYGIKGVNIRVKKDWS